MVPDGCSTEERPIRTQAGGNDPRSTGELEAALAVQAPLRRIEEPATTASRRSRRFTTVATACPTRLPVRLRTSGVAMAGGAPVWRWIAGPEATASKQPRLPQAQGGPSGSTTTWPT